MVATPPCPSYCVIALDGEDASDFRTDEAGKQQLWMAFTHASWSRRIQHRGVRTSLGLNDGVLTMCDITIISPALASGLFTLCHIALYDAASRTLQ